VHPTGGSRRVFRQFAWLEAGSVKMASSRPAHPRVTQAVSPRAVLLGVGLFLESSSLRNGVRWLLPARAICPPSFPGVPCLWQRSKLIRFVSKVGSRANLEGSLVCESHRPDPVFGCLSKMIVALCPRSCHNGRRNLCNVTLPAVFRTPLPSVFGVCKRVPLIHAG
jgi:hypothetical protein